MSVKNINNTDKVWSRFHATRKDGRVIKLRIQDHPWEKYKEDIVDFYMKNYVNDEAFNKAAGISNNEEAKTEYQEVLYFYYDENEPHVSICFVDDDSNTNDIIGMSLLNVVNAESDDDDFKDFKPQTKEMQNLLDILSVTSDINVSEDYKTYYDGRGIYVRTDYRGLGIANEFIRLRKQICIDNNIPMTCAWMTSIGTQKAAAKYNWKTFMEMPVAEFERKTGLPFKADSPIFKLMYTTKD